MNTYPVSISNIKNNFYWNKSQKVEAGKGGGGSTSALIIPLNLGEKFK